MMGSFPGEVNPRFGSSRSASCPQQMHYEAEQHQTRAQPLQGSGVFIEQQGGGHHADTGNQQGEGATWATG